jgi:hypothetical protein
MKRIAVAAIPVLLVLPLVAGPREDAVPFTPEEARGHAKTFCSRAGDVMVFLPSGDRLRLCGWDREHALVHHDDVLDLFMGMNTEALLEAWVFFEPTHGAVAVFNLERSGSEVFQKPKIAFAAETGDVPLGKGADALRAWLFEQNALENSAVSPEDGAVITWGPVAKEE